MRHGDRAREWFARALDKHYQPSGDQPSSKALFDIELGLYLLRSVAPDQAATGVPALLDGYGALYQAVGSAPADADVRLANGRILLWRRHRPYDWGDALQAYRSVPDRIRGYDLKPDNVLAPRDDCRVAADRWSWYQELLTQPLAFKTTTSTIAGEGSYRMGSTLSGQGINLPADLPTSEASRTHDLRVRPRKPIEVSWDELLTVASDMDRIDRENGEHNDWWERLNEINLQVRQYDQTFGQADVLRIDTVLHMVGMVSVGKTTLIKILAVWAARNDHHVTIVVGDNSTALHLNHDLSGYSGVRTAPVMGKNRRRHAERLHHLQPPETGKLLPVEPFGFDLVSTACAVNTLIERAEPLDIRDAPCEDFLPHNPDKPADQWRDAKAQICPFWHRCQRHEAARQLVDANVWIATPWSLVHTQVPTPLTSDRMRYFEAAWRRSDLIMIDEADQVQSNLDEMFANAQALFGPGEEAWVDEIGSRTTDRLRAVGRAQTRSKPVRRFVIASNQARTAGEVIYQILQRDRARAGHTVLGWIDKDYFTSSSLFEHLAKTLAGFDGRDATSRMREPWDDDPLYRELRHQFNDFIDSPTSSVDGAGLADDLRGLAKTSLSNMEEDAREAEVRRWLADLGSQELASGRRISDPTMEDVRRLEFAIAVAVLAHRLNQMLAMWPQVSVELGMQDAMTSELRKPPNDLVEVVPDAPMGNVLGFQYVDDEAMHRDHGLGEFRFFRYSGVGRTLLTDLPGRFPADGNGPNVLLLSGTSWAGTSPRYHVDIPVNAILQPPDEKLAKIAKTTCAFDPQQDDQRQHPIVVSGRYGDDRWSALEQMVKSLLRGFPDGRNRLEREHEDLPPGQQKLLLLVGSYKEARTVTESLMKLKPSWKEQVKCLVGDDELDTGWEAGLRRGDVAEFGIGDAWILVAPMLAIERGHNILNEYGSAALGAAFFLVRPHPRPKDLAYVTQRINQHAQTQMTRARSGTTAIDCVSQLRLEKIAEQRRGKSRREWLRLLHTSVAYSQLGEHDRNQVTWTQLVTIWQVIGRLLRGGEAAKVYFCDAAFAPKTAQRADGMIDTAGTSLLHGMRDVLEPYFDDAATSSRQVAQDRHLVRALYQPLYQALAPIGSA